MAQKENIFNFWIPRFLVCILIYFFYDNSQLSLDPKDYITAILQ